MRVGRADGGEWLRLSDAAETLGVSVNTLRRWSDTGKMTCYRSPGGHRRYRRVDIQTLLHDQNGGHDGEGRSQSPAAELRPAAERLHAPLSALMQVAGEGLGVSSCGVFLAEGDRLSRVAEWGTFHSNTTPGDGAPRTDTAPVATEVLRTGRRLVITDLDSCGLIEPCDKEAYLGRGAHAALALPLNVGSKIVGVLELIQQGEARSFSGADVEFAEFMAQQTASLVAAESGVSSPREDRLPAAAPARMPAPAGIGDPGRPRQSVTAAADDPVPGSAPRLDAEALMRDAIEALCAQTGLNGAILYRPGPNGLLPALWEGRPPAAQAAQAAPHAFEVVVSRREPVALPADREDGAPADETARLLAERGCAEALLLPLVHGGGVVGVLELDAGSQGAIAAARGSCELAARLLAAVIGGGEAVERLSRRVNDLSVVAEAGLQDTARLSTDDVLHAVIRRLAQLTQTPVADIYAVEGDTLRALVSYDSGRFDDEWEGVVIPIKRYPCSRRAVETGEIVVAASLDDELLTGDGRHSLEKWGYQAQLSMPLLAGGRVLGLVELSDYEPRDFAPDLELIRGLGRVAGHALENAALFEQVERRTRVLNELVELGRLASGTRDVATLLHTAAERLLTAVDAANCDIFEARDEGLCCVASHDRSGRDEASLGSPFDPAHYPTVLAALRARELLVITSPDDPQLSGAEQLAYHDYGFASEVCVPLAVDEQLYGFIDIYDTRERDYTEYVSFLQSAGQILAGALQNALLFRQVDQRTTVLREIVDLGALASQTHDLREVLRGIAARLRDTLQVDDCDIFTLQGEALRCVASADSHGFDESVVGEAINMHKFPTTAMAIRSGETMVIASLDDPRLTDGERNDYAAFGFQSELCIPLLAAEKVIGLIDVFDTKPRDYGEFLDFLKSVSQMAAGAIEHTLLVEELERRNLALAELVELGKLVTAAGDLDGLVRVLGPRVVDIVGADGCQVFTVQDDTLSCLLTYENGEYQEDYVGRPLDLDQFPSTRDALNRREILVIASPDDPRLSDHERDLYRESGSRSEIVVPLVADERVVGLLDVYDHRERDYDEYRDFLVSAAQIVAGTVHDALLLERLEATNGMLSLLVESGLEFGATLDLDAILLSVAHRLCNATDAPNCDIYVVDSERLRCVACVDADGVDEEYVGTSYPLGDLSLATHALETGQPTMVRDIATDPRLSVMERDEDLRWGHRAKLDVPLVSRGEAIGIASIYDARPREFYHLDQLQGLAQVAANALANATLFERLDRSAERMTLVSEVSFELSSSLQLSDVLRSTADRLCAITDMPLCDIYVLRDGRRLVDVVSVDNGEADLDWQGREFPLDAWAALETAVRTRKPVIIESLDDPLLLPAERELMEAYGETAEVAVPLIAKERVIGVLELLDNRGTRSFSQEELDTITAVCRVAALAIDNAELVEDLRLRNRETELLNEIARATAASLNLPDIAAGAMEKLRELIPFDRAMVALRRDELTYDLVYVTEPRPDPIPATIDIPVTDVLRRLREELVITLTLPEELPADFELPGIGDLGAAALIALTKGPELIGVLSLGAVDREAFTGVDHHLLERTGTHLSLAIGNAALYEDIKHMHLSNLKALSSALNAKDYYTLGHAARVAAYMVLLGEELGWPAERLRHVEEAAYLHDIGKIGVSDRVLLKPSGLNGKEWELMRQHPIFSADIIRPLFDEDLVLGVRHHHERWEGGGYPDGLEGEDIPLIARAMCVADSYDAMSFRRPYRQALTFAECLTELERCRGSQFDPAVVDAFLRVLTDIESKRGVVQAAASDAASRLDQRAHGLLRARIDEERPEYSAIGAMFRDVCAAHPPTQHITSHVRFGKKTVVVVDAAESTDKPHLGEEVFADDELVEVFAGHEAAGNVLFVDRWGVWISGTAPVRDVDGRVVAAITADLPAIEGAVDTEGLQSSVAQTYASMLQTAAAQAGRTEIEAVTDGLTGLYNHRYFHERLNEEIERALDRGSELSVLFCDLDNFRSFNELHGHGSGDRVLRAVARVIEGSVRHVDLAVRFGGEEFATILIDTGEQGALEVAERIRAGITATDFAAGASSISVSIGVATCPGDAMFKEELIDKADWAMYLAKRRGRNKVISFSAEHGSETPEHAAAVTPAYVSTMSELVAARAAYDQRRQATIVNLAQAVGRELEMSAEELRFLRAAPSDDTGAPPSGRAALVLALATAYQAMVAERPYRPQLSEAEALEELLACPALRYEGELGTAFGRVLADR